MDKNYATEVCNAAPNNRGLDKSAVELACFSAHALFLSEGKLLIVGKFVKQRLCNGRKTSRGTIWILIYQQDFQVVRNDVALGDIQISMIPISIKT